MYIVINPGPVTKLIVVVGVVVVVGGWFLGYLPLPLK